MIAGRGLSVNSNRFFIFQPVIIGAIYLLLLVMGVSTVPALIIILICKWTVFDSSKPWYFHSDTFLWTIYNENGNTSSSNWWNCISDL